MYLTLTQYETLRLYGPAPLIPRWTGPALLSLVVGGKQVALPRSTDIEINTIAIHTNPKYWGLDAETWRPDRWLLKTGRDRIETSGEDTNASPSPSYAWQSADLLRPAPGTFLPWIDGPRVCPGKKFAQVEFVRTMAGLFGGADRVRLKPEPGESIEAARSRALSVLRNAPVGAVLRMQHSEKIGMEWYRLPQDQVNVSVG
jgi:cytochrome P450